MKKILTLLTFFYAFSPLYAQLIEGNPCTATCIDPNGKITGRQPNQNGVSPNVNPPCDLSTSEDNPSWWIVRPSGNSVAFTVTTSNCVAGISGVFGVELTLWEGDACGSVTAIQCVKGTAATLTASVTPCNIYYLQIDGIDECQCNITLSYDKNQILKTVPKPVITGPSTACLGTTIKLCASIPNPMGCQSNGFTWRADPASAATITSIQGDLNCANIKINNIPTGGKIKICAKPRFNGKCPPTVQEECFEIDVTNLKTAVASSNSPVCEGKTAMLEASGGTSYLWSGPDNFSSTLANPTIPNVQAKNAGLYSVEVTNADNCKGKATTNLVVENCISSEDISNKNIQIYPNPFTQQLNIDATNVIRLITIYNILGQIVFEREYDDLNLTIDLSELKVGYYSLKVKDDTDEIYIRNLYKY
jgi:hypothetical protein